MFGFSAIELRLIRPPVNREKEIALLNLFALYEMNLLEIPTHSRAHLDSLRRFQPTDVFIPLNNIAGKRLYDRDDRRSGSTWCGTLATAARNKSNQKNEC